MKKKHVIITLVVLFLGLFIIFFFDRKEVTFYFIVGNAQQEKIDVSLVVNGDSLFNDYLLNHRYEIKMIEKKFEDWFLEIDLYSGEKLLTNENMFILFQKHIVVEYNDNCKGGVPCFYITKRFQPFKLE